MAQIPPGRLTFKQIRDLALRKAGNPALGVQTSSTTPSDATLYLVQSLYDLYTQDDWPFLFTQTDVQLTGSTFPLPSGFLKPQDDSALVVATVNGQPSRSWVQELDEGRFTLLADPNVSGTIPQFWSVDYLLGIGRLFPNLGTNVALGTLRYKFLPVTETTVPTDSASIIALDATIPVFPWSFFLVQTLLVQVLQYDSSDRLGNELEIHENMFKRLRETSFPFRSTDPTVGLDTSVFGGAFNDTESGGGFLGR